MFPDRLPDLSHWDGPTDFARMKGRRINHVLIKATEGLAKPDNMLIPYATGAHLVELLLSFYLFFHPELDPTLQGDLFASTVLSLSLPFEAVVLDVEIPPTGALNHSARLLTCLLRIEEKTGLRPLIYTRASFWRLYYAGAYSWALFYPLLIAHYKNFSGPDVPMPWSPNDPSAWQYTDRENGPLYGTTSKMVDMSVIYDYPPQKTFSVDTKTIFEIALSPVRASPPKTTLKDLWAEIRLLSRPNHRRG